MLPRAGLSREGARAVERVCARMGELVGPPEPPARLHGDLWSGNVLWGRDGRAWLIDPAAYGGHREVDLAMLQLFGNPGRHFFAAYEERFPLSRRPRGAGAALPAVPAARARRAVRRRLRGVSRAGCARLRLSPRATSAA